MKTDRWVRELCWGTGSASGIMIGFGVGAGELQVAGDVTSDTPSRWCTTTRQVRRQVSSSETPRTQVYETLALHTDRRPPE